MAASPPNPLSLQAAEQLRPEVSVAAHRQYTIPLNALLEGRTLEAADSTGWRSIAPLRANPQSHASLLFSTLTHEVSEMNRGPFVAGTLEAYRDLLTLDQTGEYEMRFLLIPSIYIAAIWLANEQGADKFYILPPAPQDAKTNTLLSEDEFKKTLVAEAARVGNFNSEPR